MASPKDILVKESLKELRSLQRKYGELIGNRIQLLIEIKKSELVLSKRRLSEITGINHNSINKWRNIYIAEGIAPFLVHGRIGFKKSIISKENHAKLEVLLKNPSNGITGYVELLEWVKTELGLDMKYITLLKYVQRHFGTKIKVARKSHINKNDDLVADFKKTLLKNVPK